MLQNKTYQILDKHNQFSQGVTVTPIHLSIYFFVNCANTFRAQKIQIKSYRLALYNFRLNLYPFPFYFSSGFRMKYLASLQLKWSLNSRLVAMICDLERDWQCRFSNSVETVASSTDFTRPLPVEAEVNRKITGHRAQKQKFTVRACNSAVRGGRGRCWILKGFQLLLSFTNSKECVHYYVEASRIFASLLIILYSRNADYKSQRH